MTPCPNCADPHILGNTCARCSLCIVCDELADDCACPTPAAERFEAALEASA